MTWEFTPELEATIIKHIVSGKSLRAIGRMDDMPSRDVIMKWEQENPQFAANVARARDVKHEDDIDRLEEINERVLSGDLKPDAATAVSNNLKWVAARMMPKKYGDKLDLNHGGQSGNQLPPSVIVTTAEEGARVYADMLKRAQETE